MRLNFFKDAPASKSAVLLIYTGGTIGMKEDPVDGALRPFDFDSLLDEVPELRKFALRIDHYTFSPLIDSSDVEPSMWQAIAGIIRERYDDYDGFVILHGTDTMAYSASAMSFMFDHLDKPVIFTGSQLPIGRPRTDGKENLISAVEIAAARDSRGGAMVPEVCICFNSHLYRGNRSTKVNATGFDAFASPNYPPLATAGINIKYNSSCIHYPSDRRKPLTESPPRHDRAGGGRHTPRLRKPRGDTRDLRLRQRGLQAVVPQARQGSRGQGEDTAQRDPVPQR